MTIAAMRAPRFRAPCGARRNTAGQIAGFVYEYGNKSRRGAPFGAAAFIAHN